jgi:hypothetical protein
LQWFQSASLVVEVAHIIVHERDEPDALVGLLDADGLCRPDRTKRDGVCRRENSRYRQCSAYLVSRNWRISTKTESLAEAKDIAEDWYFSSQG